MRELYDPIEDINDNAHKRIVNILIAPNDMWKERRKSERRKRARRGRGMQREGQRSLEDSGKTEYGNR